ncbi:MAG: PD40 domain-containing protein [Myxococcales bacterium]|nr:PD40 domain-containing protein [Myxococcales bacterium]
MRRAVVSSLLVLGTLGSLGVAQAPAPPLEIEAAPDAIAGPFRTTVARVALRVSGEPAHLVRELDELLRSDLVLVPMVEVVPAGARTARVVVRPQGLEVAVALELDGDDASTPLFTSHRGSGLRSVGHAVAADLVAALTGARPTFAGRLAFARREPGGRKQIWVADWDGFGLHRVSSPRHTGMLPGFVGHVLWWTVLDPQEMYLTNEHAAGRSLVGGDGTQMGVAGCGGGLAFSSSRSGDSELWWGERDGSSLRKLTDHPGIDVSPSCAGGRMAFVSNRNGTPRIYLASVSGEAPIPVTEPPGETQTPSLCAGERGLQLAYTRISRGMRVELLDVASGARRMLSPPGWNAKDPSFSPDCRFVAYVARGQGVVVASVDDPSRRRVVVTGPAETVRWGPPPPPPLPIVDAPERVDELGAPRRR